MRPFDPATQASLDAGRIVDRRLVLLDLGSGLYGFHNGLGPFVYNGITYTGAGSLLEIEGVRQTADLSAVQVVGRLTGIPDSALTPDILATIENEVYHQRPCTLMVAFFNPTTFALLSVEVDYRGIIDRMVHKEQSDGSAVLEVNLESRFRDHQKSGYRVRSDADQRRIDPTDDSLRHVTQVVNEQVIFGRLDAATTEAVNAYHAKKENRSWLSKLFG